LEEGKNRGVITALKVMVTVPKEFNRDRLKFHQTLESKKKITAREVEPYWKSLWEEEAAQINERAQWLRREEKSKFNNMDLGPIQIAKITSFL
jgi:hypothetical protein